MNRIFAFTNHKGGVGKSTSATNIAYGIVSTLRSAGASNPRVLLIDTDSQSHATLVTTGRKNFDMASSLYAVLIAERADAPSVMARCIVQSTWDNDLHVLPASPELEAGERELLSVPGAPYRLAEPLAMLTNQYAAIVIDTRPSFSLLTEMALVAATDAIIPVEPRYLETVGLLSVIQKINDIRVGWRQPNLHVGGILVTKLDSRVKGHAQLLDELRTHPVLGRLLLGVIPANEAVSYAHHSHQSVFTFDPRCPASKAYAQLVGTLIRQMVSAGGVR